MTVKIRIAAPVPVAERLDLDHLDVDMVLAFLDHLKSGRSNGIGTRNNRLTAIQSFFRYLQSEEPQRLAQCQRILAISHQRHPRPPVNHLVTDDLRVILAGPELATELGRRDAVLLTTLYDTGARVQELIDLRVRDVRLDAPAQVRLVGKGRKVRVVPLLQPTAKLLGDFIAAHDLGRPERGDEPLFQNRWGEPLSRSGVRYIVDKYVANARKERPGMDAVVSPHTFRHTKAMHLVQAGNPIVVIRDILGHTDIATASIYARLDLEVRRAALEKAAAGAPAPPKPSWQTNPDLLSWLRSL